MTNSFLFALVYIFILSSCNKNLEIEIVDTFAEPYQFNIVGIIGEESDTAYVEVWYSEMGSNGKNKIIHKWVKLL